MMCTNVPDSCTYVQQRRATPGSLTLLPVVARPLCLGGRANQAEIAPGTDFGRRTWLEVLAEKALAHLEHDTLDSLEVIGRPPDRNLLVGQHVPVAPRRPLEAPCLPRREAVDGELHVRLELARRLRVARLVVDQLVAAVRQLVHPVHPAAQVVWADAEVELALHPARLRPARHLARVVAMQRLDRLLAELELVVGLAEARPPPGDCEEAHQPLHASGVRIVSGLLSVEALEHLVNDDPEALVDGCLLRDAEDAGELVLEGARPIELDVGRRESKALAAPRQECLERRLVALGDQLTAALRRPL